MIYTSSAPVLAALQAWDPPVIGLQGGSHQGCSEALQDGLAREAADASAQRVAGRCRGRERARATDEALGIFMHDVYRRWGSVVWRSWLVGARHFMRKSRPSRGRSTCAQPLRS